MAAACQDDQGKRQAEKEYPYESEPRQTDQQRGLQGAAADTHQRFDHDHQHRRLDAEQGPVYYRDAAPQRVEDAQPQHDQCARQHEQYARRQAAAQAMQ
jgi:hypothetical protein